MPKLRKKKHRRHTLVTPCKGAGKLTRDVTCNRCGASCVPKNVTEPYGLKGEMTTGYHSPVLPDMQRYRFRLCEDCCKWLFEQFKIPVDVSEYNFG